MGDVANDIMATINIDKDTVDSDELGKEFDLYFGIKKEHYQVVCWSDPHHSHPLRQKLIHEFKEELFLGHIPRGR